MDDIKTRNVLVSIAASWAGKRNSGNVRKSEHAILQNLLAEGLVKIEDDETSPTHWISLTEDGKQQLYKLNRKFINSK